MVPCDEFDAGEASDNQVDRAHVGPIAAIAMKDSFLLRNVCDGDDCKFDRLPLPELSAGSQLMLSTAGHFLVGIDDDTGRIWTHEFDDNGHRKNKEQTYVHPDDGPAMLVIGLRDSDSLIVRDRSNRLAVYEPRGYQALPIADDLGPNARLAAVGEHDVVVRIDHDNGTESLYMVDVGDEPLPGKLRRIAPPLKIATGHFTSVVFGPGDGTLVLSSGKGRDASVIVVDVATTTVIDAFEGDVISAPQDNDKRAVEEFPGLHAISPSGDQIAYRTVSGSLAVRRLGTQSSCLVRNTNRLGTGRDPGNNDGNHVAAGFSADGIIYAQYRVGTAQSFVYAYEPQHQQMTTLGREESGWRLTAVPGRVTAPDGEAEQLWAVGRRDFGEYSSIGERGAEGNVISTELMFMPRNDKGVWALDVADDIEDDANVTGALSVRRIEPPTWTDGNLRFDQQPEDQIIDHFVGDDDEGPLLLPVSGTMCVSSGVPGRWAYHCGDLSSDGSRITTNSGNQERHADPNSQPEFDPPPPAPSDDGEDEEDEEDQEDDSGDDGDPTRN
ncbi:MAG: hypothetical protein AAF799_40875 [Myxococcota bacterium]